MNTAAAAAAEMGLWAKKAVKKAANLAEADSAAALALLGQAVAATAAEAAAAAAP